MFTAFLLGALAIAYIVLKTLNTKARFEEADARRLAEEQRAKAEAEEAAEEGRYLVNWYKNNNVNAEMGVFYDLEEWHNEDYSHSDATITPAAYDSIIQSYKQVLNDNGISVSVYAGKNFAETRFTDHGRSQVQWIAQYNTRCTYEGTYRGWQFTSTASLPGVNGNVDLSIFYY